ncbi:MAG: aldo/keto reductase [Acidobacteria bacterium]|nr:aldo/keto reductase [Acidobacteriota bacterium]
MSKVNRRQFFAGLGTGLAGLGLAAGRGGALQAAPPEGASAVKDVKIRKYNPLGNTGIKTSDIIFGAGTLASPNVARYAFDLGINVFDTAEGYMNGRSEEFLGTALKGVRDKCVIISKHFFGDRTPTPSTSKAALVEKVNASLKRLNTDVIDILFIHGPSSMEIVEHPGLQDAYAQLKKDGKVRFTGFSTHNAKVLLKESLKPGLKDFFQAVLFMYNHMEGKEIEPLIAEVRKQGVGTIAMKTLAGNKQDALKAFVGTGMSYPQAAIAWVLSNPALDCAVLSMKTFAHVEEYVGASGRTVTRKDLAALRLYRNGAEHTYCRVTCDRCEKACPNGVAISDIQRFKMYYEDYGHERTALDHYRALDPARSASPCAACAAPCAEACPYGLDVRRDLVTAHELLAV